MKERSCHSCGRTFKSDLDSPLCRRCNDEATRSIRGSISSCGTNNMPCPTCKGHGHTLQKVLVRDTKYGKLHEREDNRRCPTCFGTGHIKASLPLPEEVEVVPSDIGLTKRTLGWRKINKVGGINGLPRFSGLAFATDGILVAIRRDCGKVVIGHMSSFVEVVEEKPKKKRLSLFDKLALEFS